MKLSFFTAAVVAFLSVGLVRGQEAPECPSNYGTLSDFFPHPDCTKYYICDNGVAVVEDCPPGLYFNPSEDYCDFPENVPECHGGTRPPPGPQCLPGDTTLPHPDCTMYYVCDNGVATEETCPIGLYWSPAVESCDYPENVPECRGGTRPPGGGTTTPTTTVGTSQTPPSATPTRTTVPTTVPTTTTPTTTTLPPGQCPSEGVVKIPHETLCDHYYLCFEGEKVEQVCAPGLLFDPVLGDCNFEDQVNCTPGATTAPPPTSQPTGTTGQPPSSTGVPPDLPQCPSSGNFFIPYPGNCTLYIHCLNGLQIIYRCPEGLLFDSVDLQCKDPSSAVCSDFAVENIQPRGGALVNRSKFSYYTFLTKN